MLRPFIPTFPLNSQINILSPSTTGPAMANQHPSPQEIRQRVNYLLNKLSDRDTESMAAAELSSLIRTLSADSLAPFISAVGDTRPTDKTPLRRHSLRLLSLLARSIPHSSLSPHLPRLLAAALRRLRDPDSSVRAALVDAVRSVAAAAAPAAFVSTILRPLVDALFHEQDVHPQSVSALSLSASLEECNRHDSDELPEFLLWLVPRLVKLSRSPAFKAKAAVLSLLGDTTMSAPPIGDAELRALVNCLLEFLRSQDWATRNAAAVTLTRLAAAQRDRLSGFKSSCVVAFESRKYDKVKIVRDSMNRMLEVWKEIPDKDLDAAPPPPQHSSESRSSSYVKDFFSNEFYPTNSPKTSCTVQSRISACRSPPPAASSVLPSKKTETNSKKDTKLFDEMRKSDRRIEFTLPDATPCTDKSEDMTNKGREFKTWPQARAGNNSRSRLEVKRALFEKNWEEKKSSILKSGSRVVPFHENGCAEVTDETGNLAGDGLREEQKDDGLLLIRMQLVQIENQQSTLLNLLQKFMGSSQNGIHSLEERVRGIERALDDMSRDIATSSARALSNDQVSKLCCRLPGTEFLSSKFWRRAESTYPSRLLIYKEHQKFEPRVGFVNPLAEANPQLIGNTMRYNGAKIV